MTKLQSFLIATFLVFSYNQVNAQPSKGLVYSDVIEINDTNTKEVGEHYLCNIPIKDDQKNAIFYNNACIPNDLFFKESFYPHLKEFIVIAPDWNYINSARREHVVKKRRTRPVTIFYHIKRENDRTQVDSVVIKRRNQPKLIFQEIADLPVKFQSVYHVDHCGIDRPIEFSTVNEFVDGYQKINNLQIQNTYSRLDNELNCATVYFTLANLSAQKKVSFILGRWYSKITERHTKKIARHPPQIFTPVVMETNGLKIWNSSEWPRIFN